MHLPLPLALKQDLGSSLYSKGLLIYIPGLIQFSSVSQSCLTLWNPMDCSTPGFPVHHHLLEIAQTHVHRVSDAIQPSLPLSSPSPPAFNLSQHSGSFSRSKFFFFFFFFSFVFISWRLITLQYCSGFCHTLTWISHKFTCVPRPDPPSHLLPHPIPLGLPSTPALSTCLMHSTWAGDLFHPLYYTCFNAILSEHPTLAFSHRVPKCVLYICISFSTLHIGLSLPYFKIPYLCISILYWSLSFWLTSPCIMGSSFIHLIRTDSNEFFLMAE